MKIGALDYLVKPFDPDQLVAKVLSIYQDGLKTGDRQIEVGAVVLACGTGYFDPRQGRNTVEYGSNPHVFTNLELERILSGTGPTGGRLVRPADRRPIRKIAWLQCVGSRDSHHGARGYCSSVCCTYAVKEAILAKEHSQTGLDAAIFYIDIRTFGKDFERYYHSARNRGVRFIKSRISRVEPMNTAKRHPIVYIDPNGRKKTEEFDIVVLSIGLEVGHQAVALAENMELDLGPYRHVRTNGLDPIQTSRPGIYVCGTLQAPKDIPTAVIDASAAAAKASTDLSDARWSRTLKKEPPPEIDFRGEPPRIGVFVCCCGTNIAGFVDVPAVVEFAGKLPNVVYA
jgi:heterodisulfide reductase subunit A